MRCLPVLLLLPATLHAQVADAEIEAQVRRYADVVSRGNPDALASLYLRDPRTTSIGDGRIYAGWETVRDLLRGVRADAGMVRMAWDSLVVLPLGDDAAVATFRYRWTPGDREAEPLVGAMTLVFTRTPGGWRVAHDHTSTLAELPEPTGGPEAPVRETVRCTIERIVDGDTVDCPPVGRVRLIGIDTPELSQEPFGQTAADALAAVIPVGTTLRLEEGVERLDPYGRVLGYLWHDGVLVNWTMIREGWAVLLSVPPNVQYADWFVAAQQAARGENRGLWAEGGFECLPRDRRRDRC